MFRKLCVIGLAFLMSSSIMTLTADAQDKVTGPWMWMIMPNSVACGADATHVDEIDEQTGGKLSEEDVAEDGITPKVLRVKFKTGYEWTEGEIAVAGGNNLQLMLNDLRFGPAAPEVDLNSHCAYAVINAKSKKSVKDATARVGSDDSVKVWVNGKEVHANAVNRGAGDFQDTFNVDIKVGDNVIMVKVCECGGGWSMFFGIQADLDYNLKFEGWPVEPADKLATQWGALKGLRNSNFKL